MVIIIIIIIIIITTTGKTTLLMKNKENGTIPNNYRPITCLPTTFKLMTAIIAEAMLNHLENNGLIPDEQVIVESQEVRKINS